VFNTYKNGEELSGASVHVGVVNGVNTLVVAFRGTDGAEDAAYWPTMAAYYETFAPLTRALHNYIRESGVEQVWVTGHSLGGAMAQYFVQDLSDGQPSAPSPGVQIYGATFGSPGVPPDGPMISDPRIVHFEHTQDLVGALPELLRGATELAA